MIPVLIVTRLTSQRMPRKAFMDIGGMSLIEHVVQRCKFYDLKPYLCVPEGEEKEFAEHTSCLDIFVGNPSNPGARVIDAAKHWQIDYFHQLDGDDPYFNPDLIYAHHSSLLPPIESEGGSGLCGRWYNLKQKIDLQITRLKLDDCNYRPIWFQRLTVDYPEDLELMHALHRMGCDYMTPRPVVDELFRRNPDLYKINWFRTEEWKKRQNSEKHRRRI